MSPSAVVASPKTALPITVVLDFIHHAHLICISMLPPTHQSIQEFFRETSLAVQWLKLCASNAGGPDSIPGQGTRSHMLQLKVLCAVIKTLTPTADKNLKKKEFPGIAGNIDCISKVFHLLQSYCED